MSFEDILGLVSESPRELLILVRPEGQTLYKLLKKRFETIPTSFHLQRLSIEF
jgi:hypothetical protein